MAIGDALSRVEEENEPILFSSPRSDPRLNASTNMMASTEDLPLLSHKVVCREDAAHVMSCYFSSSSHHEEEEEEEELSSASAPSSTHNNYYDRRINMLKTGIMHVVCILLGYLLNTSYNPLYKAPSPYHYSSQYYSEQSSIKILGRPKTTEPSKESTSSSYSYTRVQTISFQIYTGGAPAFISSELSSSDRNKKKKVHQNPECKGLHSYGMYSGDTDEVQCYLGLDNTTEDVIQRLSIMTDAVEKAYTLSIKDDSILKIFLAPEFYFRGINGAFEFKIDEEEMEMEDGRKCSSDMCQILSGLEQIVADVRFENWLFLFGTVIASEATSRHHQNHLHNKKHDVYVNFAPLYRGYNPKTSNGVGKKFIVPKRYVSTADFLTPLRDLTNRSIFELLDDENDQLSDPKVVPNPFEKGAKTKYGNKKWVKYKDELTSYGYNMIEYGWIILDNITFSVEICLDHLVHRALKTYLADVVTGSQTLIPSSANDTVSWVGIPKQQAHISLVSSAGMDVIVGSLALANKGYIFLQDGVEGNLPPSIQYGQDTCTPYEYEFFGGSQSVKRTSIISATDVTFDYEMNFNYIDYNLYDHQNYWKEKLRGVFSGTKYQPKLTVYAPVSITY